MILVCSRKKNKKNHFNLFLNIKNIFKNIQPAFLRFQAHIGKLRQSLEGSMQEEM
jgi:hypothetical protein